MTLLSFALVITGVVLNALAQSLLKLGTNQLGGLEFTLANAWPIALRTLTLWPFLLGFTCYAVSLVVWIIALSRVPVTVAYPMLSIGYVINAFIAWQWFGEALAAQVPLIYGGSVNQQNTLPFMSQPNVDGVFMGRVGWKAETLLEVINMVVGHEQGK